MQPSKLKHTATLACISALAVPAFAAEDYPKSPITLVVGYGAGGSTDVCNRVLALDVGKQLGQPVVVDNKPGAGSSLSISFIIRQRPDGYSIASLSTGAVLNQVLSPNIKYDVTKDLTPIAMVAQYQVGVLVRADSPYKTMADLIGASQSAKKQLTYSTAGIGTPQHLTAERLAQKIAAQWVHAPYKSGPEAITALIRGDVDFMAQTAEWVPYVRDGRLRLLSVFTDERIKGFDAPTLKELGYDLVAPSILGIAGPAKMDAAIVKKLQDAFHKASQTAEFQSCADQFGLKPDFKDASTFGVFLKDTLSSWTPLLKQFANKE
ncbi:tripartite tricarboxylate transporter substrate binding protein [Diaphorobacter limosus]|jgi:tripartite-type tricarboxylate transporter receptor subunit TctC|uniref:Tripartite tricarboxylate transporter substrate binding protein n=1 Tax=Diaphorobacter limosus TaxID=3036128 RepID=A0ABZ0J7J9_9BURK|nr:tripartite tricarboxylate transporter substrate binding protein [Diaphorobacter sp. Y-1]WOO34245.1 tripartite tricarboxylate transporter substrate binding protein [Diaphorobacter sp. Y-1]HRL98949.1 tripartite tricarboxylate transporter substrate binding protein [Acidovorax sp.]